MGGVTPRLAPLAWQVAVEKGRGRWVGTKSLSPSPTPQPARGEPAALEEGSCSEQREQGQVQPCPLVWLARVVEKERGGEARPESRPRRFAKTVLRPRSQTATCSSRLEGPFRQGTLLRSSQ